MIHITSSHTPLAKTSLMGPPGMHILENEETGKATIFYKMV